MVLARRPSRTPQSLIKRLAAVRDRTSANARRAECVTAPAVWPPETCSSDNRAGPERSCRAQRHLGPSSSPGPAEATTTDLGVVERSEEHTSELQSQSNLVCRL